MEFTQSPLEAAFSQLTLGQIAELVAKTLFRSRPEVSKTGVPVHTGSSDAACIRSFIAETLVRIPRKSGRQPGVSSVEVYAAYLKWAAANGHSPLSAIAFNRLLVAEGFERYRRRGIKSWRCVQFSNALLPTP